MWELAERDQFFLNWSHETLTQYVYYNVDTMKPAENIQNDEGFFDLGKITFKLTGKLPKIWPQKQQQKPTKKVQKMLEAKQVSLSE